ncbi:Uncharacterised protein [uncultured archaeon]|nr:Uncharacterised protein [uncultured archaeon]
MSLITLTFANGRNDFYNNPNALVSSPESRLNQRMLRDGAGKGTAVVKKACRFYSHDDVFILAEVADGFVAENMKASFGDKEVRVVSLESKYGRSAKKGMIVGMSVSGIDEEELPIGSTLNFELK